MTVGVLMSGLAGGNKHGRVEILARPLYLEASSYLWKANVQFRNGSGPQSAK